MTGFRKIEAFPSIKIGEEQSLALTKLNERNCEELSERDRNWTKREQ